MSARNYPDGSCVLHIGTHKTGTTTIQNFFAKEAETLREKGIQLDKYLSCSTGTLMRYAANDSKLFRYRIENKETDTASINQYRAQFETRLASLAAAGSTAVFIDEAAELLEQEEILRLIELFNKYFKNITVILYVRPQVDLATSLYTQHLRSGERFPEIIPEKWYSRHHPRFDYLTKAKSWNGALTPHKGNFIIREFHRSKLFKSDAVRDFIKFLDINDDFPPFEEMNTSLSVEGQTLLRKMNKFFHENSIKDGARLRVKLLNLLEALPDIHDKGRLPSREKAKAFMAHFHEDNLSLKQFLSNPTDDFLRVNYDRFPEKDTPEHMPPLPIILRLLTEALR
ncbi:hypothetical protein [Acuticoccus mangrovi]|uniref:Uncharacterized protein n=1 Tax=Acuticoccus mangrovi TaxID=2796142 RepID=A0A934ILM9_9HYPH|nr:hypothetical protein [Acuticoccus mangrovi]MBJ3778773.1 hypothetical protein [Acuticoccus mangrovi]